MKSRLVKNLSLIALITLPNIASAETFWVSGKVTRTMIETDKYGKCMIQVDQSIGNGCPSNWVSLDCENKYHAAGDGDRMLNIALLAQNLDKTVSVSVDNTRTHSTYCVAKRIDLTQ